MDFCLGGQTITDLIPDIDELVKVKLSGRQLSFESSEHLRFSVRQRARIYRIVDLSNFKRLDGATDNIINKYSVVPYGLRTKNKLVFSLRFTKFIST